MPTVAIASEFLDAFARIPRAQQRKVREFTEKFRTNPKGPGINYEKIYAVKDDKVRTVRIDQKYRAVILHPEQGDVYVLVWVDNHDEAMDWAGKRRFEVNPVTGSLQVFSVSEAEETVAPQKKTAEPGLLDAYTDDVLLSFGVPQALIPSVRAVKKQDALLALVKHLPAEASEALTWLAEGMPVEEVQAAVTVAPVKEKVDAKDLEKALENPDTKRRFVTIKSQEDLTAILNAPLAKWRVFLHPNQDKLVTKKFNGPARVLGGVGTGKTVVAMHRARHLAKHVFPEKTDQILFTTKTANLAESIEQNLRSLCGDEMSRIEVVHLDAWAIRFMKTQGVDFKVASEEEIEQSWEEALSVVGEADFDVGFLKQEWELVVQMNGITSLAEYLQVPRTGRGRTLTKPQRGRVWKVFEEFRSALKDKGKHEWLQVIQETRRYLEKKKSILPYRAVVVDESQDFHPEEWKLIRALVPEGANDLFLVGDAHQRIYGPQAHAEGMRGAHPGSLDAAQDQLPHHRADPQLVDGPSSRDTGGRSGWGGGPRGWLPVASFGGTARGSEFRDGRRGGQVPRRGREGTSPAQAARRGLLGGPDQEVCRGTLSADAQGGENSVGGTGEEN